MKKGLIGLLCVVVVQAALFVTPDKGHSEGIIVEMERTASVSVSRAEVVKSSNDMLKIKGELFRPHRLTMAGHLHAYVYAADGSLVSDSQHRLSGLNSQRGGAMRLPFGISIEKVPEEVDRVLLVYHSPGQKKS